VCADVCLFLEGAKGPAGSKRAYLQARQGPLALERKLGKMQVISVTTPDSQKGGYFCKVCECVLRDSATYMDHINGKKRERTFILEF
jgi:U4/U6.U5 tri-snRNP component SNU23